MSSGTPPSQHVVEEIARADGEDPTTLEPPLYRTIDPDALDAFVESAAADATVSFVYRGYEVAVDGTGEVTLTETETKAGPESGAGTTSTNDLIDGSNDDSKRGACND